MSFLVKKLDNLSEPFFSLQQQEVNLKRDIYNVVVKLNPKTNLLFILRLRIS